MFLNILTDWLSNEVLDYIGGAAEKALRQLGFSLCKIIYRLIIWLYNMFELLCSGRLVNSEIMSEISKRAGLTLGLVMLFRVGFSLIQMLIDPDIINDKERGAGAIVKKVLIVIVLLGTSNFLFDTLYSVQRMVVQNHIISRIILPYNIDSETEENFGYYLSEELMHAFYKVENIDNASLGDEDLETVAFCENMVRAFRNQMIQNGRFELGQNCLTDVVTAKIDTETNVGNQENQVFVIDFSWFLSIITGVAVCYLIFMYCLKIGVRMIQLMVLEIISPAAFVSYISPKKDTMLSKWLKIYTSTYIDVFIRIAIINFVVLLISILFSKGNMGAGMSGFIFWDTVGGTRFEDTVTFITVVMILALLTFAHKAPELLKELIPQSASKLGFGASMKDIVGLNALVAGAAGIGIGTIGRVPGALANTGKAIGRIGDNVHNAHGFRGKAGALIGGTARAIGTGFTSASGVAFGGVSGALRGGYAGLGAKGGIISVARAGQQAQAKANLARAQRITSGAGFVERATDAARGFLGMEGGYAQTDSTLSAYNNLNSLINDEDIVKDYQKMYDTAVKKISELAAEGKSTAAAEAQARRSQAQLKAVKEALFESIATGKNYSSGSSLLDANGDSFNLIGDIKANDSMKNALSNVNNVAGKLYANINEFKADRNALQAQSQRLHKNG